MGCCASEDIYIPDWVKPGASVICVKPIETAVGTTIAVGSKGIICYVDQFCAKVVGIEGQYPGLQVVLGGPDFLVHWERAL